MKRPRLQITESGPEWEQYDKEIYAYECAQDDTSEREREENADTQSQNSGK